LMDTREMRRWAIVLASIKAISHRLSHQHLGLADERVAHIRRASIGLPQIVIVELSQHIVFNMRPAVLHLHARRWIDHMHPALAVLLSRYLGRSEQSRQRTRRLLRPLNTGVTEEDEVLRADMLIDPASIVV